MTGLTQAGLFEGYGGLSRAVAEVLGAELVWYSEVDPAASRLLAHHHPDLPNLGDVTTIDWAAAPLVDVLTGGFPCTDVSSAGRRLGLRPGTRSGLWAHMAYGIDRLRPALVVIENVRGLLTARGAEPTADLLAAWDARDKAKRVIDLIGRKLRRAVREGNRLYVQRHQRDRARMLGRHRRAVAATKRADAVIVRAIGAVLGSLAELGYDARWCGLRAADVGAPHGRFRIFICAWPAPDPTGVGCRTEGWDDGLRAQGLEPSTATHTAGVGRGEGRPEPTGFVGGPDAPISGRIIAADTDGVGPVRDGAARGRRTGPTHHDLAAAHADGPRRERPPTDSGARGTTPGPQSPITGTGGCGGAVAADPERDRREGRADAPDSSARESDPAGGRGLAWGDYGPAVARWESVLGRVAPAPTQTGARGGQQLSPRFVEWMQGLPEGHVTDVPGLSRNEQLKLLGNGVVVQQCAAALRFLLGFDSTGRAAA